MSAGSTGLGICKHSFQPSFFTGQQEPAPPAVRCPGATPARPSGGCTSAAGRVTGGIMKKHRELPFPHPYRA